MKFFSVVIIAGVFVIVVCFAGVILDATLSDHLSNIHIAELVIDQWKRSSDDARLVADAAGLATSSTAEPEGDTDSSVSCAGSLERGRCVFILPPPPTSISVTPKLPETNVCDPNTRWSVVDYLKERKLVSTFDYRAQLASKYKIRQYRGTAEQNRSLLGILRKNFASECNSYTTASVLRNS